jgi:hypothetical protein
MNTRPPTVGDLIKALQEYPTDTPVIGDCGDSISNVVSITGAYPMWNEGKLVSLDNILISFWNQSYSNARITGRVPAPIEEN